MAPVDRTVFPELDRSGLLGLLDARVRLDPEVAVVEGGAVRRNKRVTYMPYGPTPLDLVEYELELLAITTRPLIHYLPGSRAPLARVVIRSTKIELPGAWWGAPASPRKRARDLNTQTVRSAKGAR